MIQGQACLKLLFKAEHPSIVSKSIDGSFAIFRSISTHENCDEIGWLAIERKKVKVRVGEILVRNQKHKLYRYWAKNVEECDEQIYISLKDYLFWHSVPNLVLN